MRVLIEDMRLQWSELDRRIAELDKELAEWVRNEEAARRLMTISGIGVLNATALIAAIGQGESFARGRDLAAWLGLVPRQVTTGGKPRLVGISKRGNKYLRKLLIHGARAALPTLLESPTPLAAQAIRASLLASATTAAFLCILVSRPRSSVTIQRDVPFPISPRAATGFRGRRRDPSDRRAVERSADTLLVHRVAGLVQRRE